MNVLWTGRNKASIACWLGRELSLSKHLSDALSLEITTSSLMEPHRRGRAIRCTLFGERWTVVKRCTRRVRSYRVNCERLWRAEARTSANDGIALYESVRRRPLPESTSSAHCTPRSRQLAPFADALVSTSAPSVGANSLATDGKSESRSWCSFVSRSILLVKTVNSGSERWGGVKKICLFYKINLVLDML